MKKKSKLELDLLALLEEDSTLTDEEMAKMLNSDAKSVREAIENLDKECNNVHLHGIFKNPQDMPSVYGQLDLVLATYDATSINAQYAEPNKMYESIFFRVPIIVSKGTFLSEKVNRLGIGYAINGLDKDEIRTFLSGLTAESIDAKVKNLMAIPQTEAVNENPEMFKYLKNKL